MGGADERYLRPSERDDKGRSDFNDKKRALGLAKKLSQAPSFIFCAFLWDVGRFLPLRLMQFSLAAKDEFVSSFAFFGRASLMSRRIPVKSSRRMELTYSSASICSNSAVR